MKMNKTKKLGALIIALAMCLVLGITVLAADEFGVTYSAAPSESTTSFSNQDQTVTLLAENELGVTYSATLSKPTICSIDQNQTVTLTIKVNKQVEMGSFTAEVKVPEGLKLAAIENETLGFVENMDYNLETGVIMWISSDLENVNNDLLATVTITVPANTLKGEYEIEFEIIEISKDYGKDIWESGTTVSATLTVDNHAWGEPTTYTDNGDGTHTANYVCGNDASHTKSNAPVAHDFTNGDCVCGAKEPVIGLKGDVDRNGVVDQNDVIALLRHVLKAEIINDEVTLELSEVTGDTVLDQNDVIKILRYVLKAIDSLD